MIDAAGLYLDELTSALFDPRKRVFWGYLASAGLIAVCWLAWCRGRSWTEAIAQLFSRDSWLSTSALSDYRMMALNTAVMLVVSPRLLSQLGVSIAVFEWMHGVFGGRAALAPVYPDWLVMMSFTVCLFVFDDLARYLVHRALHRVPFLWAFHKIHHTATSLNPLTVYRTHPVEGTIFVLRGAVVHGSLTAVFVFFFGDQVTLATVFGAAVLNLTFNALGSNLRHSHIALGYWKPVERVLMSPAQHQVHHSLEPCHHDRNFGTALAIWDCLLGTHCHSEPDQALRYGVAGQTGPKAHTLPAQYWLPFLEAGRSILRPVASACGRMLQRSRRPGRATRISAFYGLFRAQ